MSFVILCEDSKLPLPASEDVFKAPPPDSPFWRSPGAYEYAEKAREQALEIFRAWAPKIQMALMRPYLLNLINSELPDPQRCVEALCTKCLFCHACGASVNFDWGFGLWLQWLPFDKTHRPVPLCHECVEELVAGTGRWKDVLKHQKKDIFFVQRVVPPPQAARRLSPYTNGCPLRECYNRN
jgi:hypothetical protein